MVDFFVREVRAVVDGELAIIRMGSCGTIGSAETGSMVVPDGAFVVTRNFDYAEDGEDDSTSTGSRYNVSKVYHADDELHKQVGVYTIWVRVNSLYIYLPIGLTFKYFSARSNRNSINDFPNPKYTSV